MIDYNRNVYFIVGTPMRYDWGDYTVSKLEIVSRWEGMVGEYEVTIYE